MNTQNKKSGFTIIEVVLVLAIAGLIFLMVFIALPALQRNQRDDQRKRDLGKVKTQLTNYMSSNRGNIPTNSDALERFEDRYLVPKNEYVDPQGAQYDLRHDPESSGPTDYGPIVYANGKVCGTDGTLASGNTRDYAFLIKLESQTVPFCLDSR